MSRPLHRAAVLLLAAACSRSPDPTVPAAAAGLAADAGGPQATARVVGPPSATRLAPAPGTRTVRPRPEPCLPDDPYAAPGALAEEARRALDAGKKDRALACAEEAVRLSPRLVAGLTARADALAALDRLEEARYAYARALAIAPDDPLALLGAADLHVRRLSAERDALEVGLEYALRGARAAQRPPWRDRQLAGELLLVAGMAENELGRNRQALSHLERALAAFPQDPDVVYERGVALFELCRFPEAQKAFERALVLSPDDPWIVHQLGLVAERRGEEARARELLARAARLDPVSFPPELPVDAGAFRAEVDRALAALSPAQRAELASVPLELRDLPETADLTAVDPPLSPAILGLFRGPPEGEPCGPGEGQACRSIVLYRKNLLRFARTRAELADQVRITLQHELGHLEGEDDDELRDRGLE